MWVGERLKKKLADTLESQLRRHIERNNISADEIAQKANVFDITAEQMLKSSSRWELDTCLRIAQGLDLDIDVTLDCSKAQSSPNRRWEAVAATRATQEAVRAKENI